MKYKEIYKDRYNQLWGIRYIDGNKYVYRQSTGLGLWSNGIGLDRVK